MELGRLTQRGQLLVRPSCLCDGRVSGPWRLAGPSSWPEEPQQKVRETEAQERPAEGPRRRSLSVLSLAWEPDGAGPSAHGVSFLEQLGEWW